MKDIPIDNCIPLGMAAAFVLAAMFLKVPEGVTGHVLLALGVLVVGIFLFAQSGVGPGVTKFVAASGLWIGPNQAFLVFLAILMVGGALFALALQALRGKNVNAIPYFPVMLLALVFSLPHAPLWQEVVGRLHGSA